MYCKYYNFILTKGNNNVLLQADAECVLENIEDEANFEYKQPNCLNNIIHKKLQFFEYDCYHISTLKTLHHNSITDYKKIWKLGGFTKCGIFDGNYDIGSERVYFGIYKDDLFYVNNFLMNKVTLLVPNGVEIPFDKIFNIFKLNNFNMNVEDQVAIRTMKTLYEIIKGAIVIYEFPRCAKICIFGKKIEDKFDSLDLPKTAIIEY